MARDHRVLVGAARLKKIGNNLVKLIGGREIHPISVASRYLSRLRFALLSLGLTYVFKDAES